MGKEKHGYGTERLSSGIDRQGKAMRWYCVAERWLSADQLGHSLATMSKAWE